MKLVYISLLFLTSCAPPLSHIEPIFQVYVDKFNYEAKARHINLKVEDTGITIKFATCMPQAAALCKIEFDSLPSISIDPEYWNFSYIQEWNKETLVFHELGHCVLHLSHDPNPGVGRVFESIMYPSNVVGDYFEHKQAYLDQLFSAKGE